MDEYSYLIISQLSPQAPPRALLNSNHAWNANHSSYFFFSRLFERSLLRSAQSTLTSTGRVTTSKLLGGFLHLNGQHSASRILLDGKIRVIRTPATAMTTPARVNMASFDQEGEFALDLTTEEDALVEEGGVGAA
jgi:hypothetical protein